MLKKIEIDCRELVQSDATVTGEGNGLEEDLREDHCRSAVQEDAAFEPRDIRDEVTEVAKTAFSKRRPGG